MGIGNAAEILESELRVLLHSVAVGIHAAKFPGRSNIALAGCVLQQFPCGFNIAKLPRAEPLPQVARVQCPLGCDRADRWSDIGGASGAIKGVGRGQPEAEPEEHNRQNMAIHNSLLWSAGRLKRRAFGRARTLRYPDEPRLRLTHRQRAARRQMTLRDGETENM